MVLAVSVGLSYLKIGLNLPRSHYEIIVQNNETD